MPFVLIHSWYILPNSAFSYGDWLMSLCLSRVSWEAFSLDFLGDSFYFLNSDSFCFLNKLILAPALVLTFGFWFLVFGFRFSVFGFWLGVCVCVCTRVLSPSGIGDVRTSYSYNLNTPLHALPYCVYSFFKSGKKKKCVLCCCNPRIFGYLARKTLKKILLHLLHSCNLVAF